MRIQFVGSSLIIATISRHFHSRQQESNGMVWCGMVWCGASLKRILPCTNTYLNIHTRTRIHSCSRIHRCSCSFVGSHISIYMSTYYSIYSYMPTYTLIHRVESMKYMIRFLYFCKFLVNFLSLSISLHLLSYRLLSAQQQ